MNLNKRDIRWKQRFDHFKKSLLDLKKAIRILAKYYLTEEEEICYEIFARQKHSLNNQKMTEIIEKKENLELAEKGLIKSFELTWELAWNVMSDYFKYQGNNNISGSRDASRDAIKEAFNKGLIDNETLWKQSIQARNDTAHNYSEDLMKETIQMIKDDYVHLFELFETKMDTLKVE